MGSNRLSKAQEQKLHTQFSQLGATLAIFSLVFIGMFIQKQEFEVERKDAFKEAKLEEWVPTFFESLAGEDKFSLKESSFGERNTEAGHGTEIGKKGKKKSHRAKPMRKKSEAVRVSISDEFGTIVWVQQIKAGKEFKDLKLDLDKLSPGTYQMKFEGPSHVFSHTIEIKPSKK